MTLDDQAQPQNSLSGVYNWLQVLQCHAMREHLVQSLILHASQILGGSHEQTAIQVWTSSARETHCTCTIALSILITDQFITNYK